MPDRSIPFDGRPGSRVAALVFLLYGMWRNPYRYKVHGSRYRSGICRKTWRVCIVQISDIHSGSFYLTEPVEQAMDMIRDLQPDLILFTGDLVNSRADETPFLFRCSPGSMHHWVSIRYWATMTMVITTNGPPGKPRWPTFSNSSTPML